MYILNVSAHRPNKKTPPRVSGRCDCFYKDLNGSEFCMDVVAKLREEST